MAIYANLIIDQGSDFVTEIQVASATGDDADLTGYTFAAQLRKTYASTTYTAFTASVVNASQGIIKIELSNAQTLALKAGRYVYDVEATLSGVITRIVEGQITVTPGVTQ